MNQMSETRDPAIKLFGKTIAVPTPEDITSALVDDQDHPPSSLKTRMMMSHEQGEEEEEEEKVYMYIHVVLDYDITLFYFIFLLLVLLLLLLLGWVMGFFSSNMVF